MGAALNVEVAREVAAVYAEAPAQVCPLVEAAYAQLQVETDRLFAACTSPRWPGAVRVCFSTCPQPYDSAEELISAVRADRVLEVTVARFDHDRRHPCFGGGVGGPFDRFRAVHDLLGHAVLGVRFDRDGEFAAWRFQERLHSPLARLALATELHAKHSAYWTSGHLPDHKALLLEEGLLRRARAGLGWVPGATSAVNPDADRTLLNRNEGGAMSRHHWASESIDGRQVNVALRDGTRIDDCQLVSCRHGALHQLWLFTNGEDVFVPCDDVADLWPADCAAAVA